MKRVGGVSAHRTPCNRFIHCSSPIPKSQHQLHACARGIPQGWNTLVPAGQGMECGAKASPTSNLTLPSLGIVESQSPGMV